MNPAARTTLGSPQLLLVIGLLLSATSTRSDDWPQWRGPRRDGLSKETGLLGQWPKEGPKLLWRIKDGTRPGTQGEGGNKEGPKLLWRIKDAGSGYSTPSVVGERLWVLGNQGLEDEFVEAFAVKDGSRLWRTRLGKVGNPDQQPKFPAARSTPTVEGERLYALSSDGDLACVESATGKVRWKKSLRADFGGKPGAWAYAESPLIDGDTLVCTPGGTDATLVALNKNTGDVLWKAAVPDGDEAAYASALVVEAGGSREYVQMLQKGLVGVAAKDGRVLWRYGKTVSKFNANIPTPVTEGASIYSAGAGTGGGLVTVKAQGATVQADEVYFSPKLPTAIGGAVRVGRWLYGTTGEALLCVEFATGAVKWQERALGAASLCFADGHLYLHGENGDVALVDANPEAFRETGRFTPPDQPRRLNDMEKAWAYPVVANGRLYLRDHDSLWCYDVRASR